MALLIALQFNQSPLRPLQEGELCEMFLKVADGTADGTSNHNQTF